MMRAIATIARYTLLEALRNRLLWVLAALALGAAGVSGFLHELALTESRELQAALLAATLRLASVFLIASFVVTSLVREAQDKGQELLLAMALPRAAYPLGKLAGFCALAVLPATLFGALALTLAPPAQAALWAMSLLCELWIVAAFGLLCALTMAHAVPALAATLSFYLLARAIASLQLLGAHPMRPQELSQRGFQAGVDAIAALLPRLDQFTQTDWLVYHSGGWTSLAAIVWQAAIYVALLCAAALFDFYRKAI
jgi:hypothetical protein